MTFQIEPCPRKDCKRHYFSRHTLERDWRGVFCRVHIGESSFNEESWFTCQQCLFFNPSKIDCFKEE